MKVNRKGEPVVEKGEVRIGNYFIKDEAPGDWWGHIKIQDLNSAFVHRVWKRLPIGIWLTNMLSRGEEAHGSIKTYVAVMWSLFSVVPDEELMLTLLDATKDALSRHPDWYGAEKEPVSDEEDGKIVEGEREKAEFIEQVKDLDKEGGGNGE